MIKILDLIVQERVRQEELRRKGRFAMTCADPSMMSGERLAVLMEEVGEVARCILEQQRLANDRHKKSLSKELIQVAAVCVAWLQGLETQGETLS